jgi:hypothetical protein
LTCTQGHRTWPPSATRASVSVCAASAGDGRPGRGSRRTVVLRLRDVVSRLLPVMDAKACANI